MYRRFQLFQHMTMTPDIQYLKKSCSVSSKDNGLDRRAACKTGILIAVISKLARISHQAAENTDKALVLWCEVAMIKKQCVIQACLSRFRLVFVSVSLLFTQTVAMATLFAPERRLRTRILRLLP